MDIEEMKHYEWVVPWSGGKDSTSTIIKMIENDVPIKYVYHVKMMFDENTPAALPLVSDFIDRTIDNLTDRKVNVKVIKSIKTASELANNVFTKSKTQCKNGYKYGCFAFMRGCCTFEKYKEMPVPKNEKVMIGYASDELNRLHRLTENKQSILYALDISERQTYNICARYNMLSPVYLYNIARDGCFFCPNAGVKQRGFIKDNYPALYKHILDMIHLNDGLHEYMYKYKDRNNWFNDYIKSQEEKSQLSYLT